VQNLESQYIENMRALAGTMHALLYVCYGKVLNRSNWTEASQALDTRFEQLHSPNEYPKLIEELKIVINESKRLPPGFNYETIRSKLLDFVDLLQSGFDSYNQLNSEDRYTKMLAETEFWLFTFNAFEAAWDKDTQAKYTYYRTHAKAALRSREGTSIFHGHLIKCSNVNILEPERTAFLLQHGIDIRAKKLSVRLVEYMEAMWPEEQKGTTAEMIQGNPPLPQGIFPEQPAVKKDPIRIDWTKRGW
jgi:hypothetical protein